MPCVGKPTYAGQQACHSSPFATDPEGNKRLPPCASLLSCEDGEVSCVKCVLDTQCFQLTAGSSGESLAEIKEDLHYLIPSDSTDLRQDNNEMF